METPIFFQQTFFFPPLAHTEPSRAEVYWIKLDFAAARTRTFIVTGLTYSSLECALLHDSSNQSRCRVLASNPKHTLFTQTQPVHRLSLKIKSDYIKTEVIYLPPHKNKVCLVAPIPLKAKTFYLFQQKTKTTSSLRDE